jgi:hypothetical protein
MSEGSDDLVPQLANKPVGYASPPYEYRWPKGYCPNPKGRPRKKKNMKNPGPPNEFHRRILEEANRVILDFDGKPYTFLDKLLLHLKTSKRPEDRKLMLAFIQEALQADHAWREEAVRNIIAFKEQWGPIFRQRRALGWKLPDVYPDPDDILVLSPTEFRFTGPVNAEQAADWAAFQRFRDMCAMFANEIIEGAGFFRPLEKDRQNYLKIRRAYYRVNRHFPIEFKKKHPFRFPPFKPAAEPPEWYCEEEDWIEMQRVENPIQKADRPD